MDQSPEEHHTQQTSGSSSQGRCMSQSSLSLASLTAQLRSLTLRVASLEERAAQTENRVTAVEEAVQEEGNGGFDLITEASSSDRTSPSARVQSAAGAEVLGSDSRGRRILAEEIGRFLRRAVEGEHRGSSGRDRLKLQNRVYVVLAGFDGSLLTEPRVESSFAVVKAICKRGADCGSSIFVGFATKWEAKVALETGRFFVPSSLRNA